MSTIDILLLFMILTVFRLTFRCYLILFGSFFPFVGHFTIYASCHFGFKSIAFPKDLAEFVLEEEKKSEANPTKWKLVGLCARVTTNFFGAVQILLDEITTIFGVSLNRFAAHRTCVTISGSKSKTESIRIEIFSGRRLSAQFAVLFCCDTSVECQQTNGAISVVINCNLEERMTFHHFAFVLRKIPLQKRKVKMI